MAVFYVQCMFLFSINATCTYRRTSSLNRLLYLVTVICHVFCQAINILRPWTPYLRWSFLQDWWLNFDIGFLQTDLSILQVVSVVFVDIIFQSWWLLQPCKTVAHFFGVLKIYSIRPFSFLSILVGTFIDICRIWSGKCSLTLHNTPI